LYNGSLKRLADEDVSSGVLELVGENVADNFITCPADSKKQLGIKLPFIVLVLKNVSPFKNMNSPCFPVSRTVIRLNLHVAFSSFLSSSSSGFLISLA